MIKINRTNQILLILVALLLLFLFWLLYLKPIAARASFNDNFHITICHHTPGNNVTLTFNNQQSYNGHLGQPHSGQTFDTNGACPSATPSPTPTVTPSPSPTVTPSPTPTPCGLDLKESAPCPTVEPSPTPEPTPGEEVHHAQLAPPDLPRDVCNATPPTKVGGNFHIYRKGDDAIAKWFPTEGDKATIYYKQVGSSDWQYSLRDIDNNGYAEIHGLSTLDITFALQQSFGCAGGALTTPIVDGASNTWVLFR